MIILPMILRYHRHEQHKQQNDLPGQVTESNNSAATTITTATQTTTVTTTETYLESQTHATLNVLCSKTVATTTKKDVTSTSTQVSVSAKNTTTECTNKSTETPTNTTTKVTTTTGGTTGANNAPVQGYYPTKEEWDMFCVVVCSETGYCEDKAQLAVAHTVINRLSNPIYPNTIKEILTQRAQYTCVSNYYTGNMRPGLEVGGEAYNHTMQLIHQAWEEWDFTHGAVAYYNPHMIGWNAWFEQYECVYEDQYGRFFRV